MEKTLELPFVSPEASQLSEQYMMGQLARKGDWGDIRTQHVDMLNAEYAMLESEGRLRQTLAGEALPPHR